ncbi:MAG: D-2-hydroxyacid dehydrogenase [Lachnospiraceae bacterium]|nr:D-2-hydroxyacid dehydrogenase [Lachnospiraceae bacterium]
MKAVLLEADAVNPGDLSWEPITSLVETTIYNNTTEEDKYEHIGDADIVFLNKVKMDEEMFERCPNIRYIGVCATGYNVIDMEAARRHGVTVTNVPAYSTESVAQLTWGLILESVCHISLHNDSVHRGDWIKSDVFCYWLAPVTELAGKTLGVVGYGNIGRRVCEIARAFNMNVLVHTAHPEKYIGDKNMPGGDAETGYFKGEHLHIDDSAGKIQFVDMDTLLAQSDIVSLHCPLTSETEGIINKSNIYKMKDGVIIINVSRGGLVVEKDLADALVSGKVASAGVDVVAVEPMKEDNPLLKAPNMTITPHMAWASLDARKRLVDVVAGNFKAFLEGRKENVVS